ncbi:DUF2274 domain-containing protein [Sphingobium phenoxybenzoativorans]|uniref:DUF2274 domain-containing protein n=1 Tax=Sphingobium phenoxybenzoativorans TaxID=1592790 RepID=UPI0009F286BE|nr:DUF2274 domain-containing protein [Sphingobium phenoxybenzoativorans]
MAARTIKLPKLPERTPVRITISINPDLHLALQRYADFYASAYGQNEAVADLIPPILDHFIASDRSFSRGRRNRERRHE